jgi:lipid A disaccharide synthetase
MPNIFDDPKSIKTWAIKLANACGGQKVDKSIILTQLNTKRIAELLDEFVADHNENTMKIAQQLSELEEE